jgi:hypothetical protein
VVEFTPLLLLVQIVRGSCLVGTLCLSTNIVVDRAKKNVRTLFPPKNREKIHISINVDYLLTPSVSMLIEGLSLEARHAA